MFLVTQSPPLWSPFSCCRVFIRVSERLLSAHGLSDTVSEAQGHKGDSHSPYPLGFKLEVRMGIESGERCTGIVKTEDDMSCKRGTFTTLWEQDGIQ